MSVITLGKAWDFLNDCVAVVVNDEQLSFPSLDLLKGEDDNEFLFVGWECDKVKFNMKFLEKDNQEVKVVDFCMYLIDSEGEEVSLNLLFGRKIEEVVIDDMTMSDMKFFMDDEERMYADVEDWATIKRGKRN